ncbi:hypothetical protein, partial [Salmonella enterica]
MSHVEQQVTLCGCVDRRRAFGSLLFLYLFYREVILLVFFFPHRANALTL